MAKLRATPKNYAEAAEVLAGRDSVRLGNNTYLELVHDGIGVRLHNTYIVRFYADGQVTLYTGGYYTTTTKERINQFIQGRVFQKDYNWFYDCPLTRTNANLTFEGKQLLRIPFTEGMVVSD